MTKEEAQDALKFGAQYYESAPKEEKKLTLVDLTKIKKRFEEEYDDLAESARMDAELERLLGPVRYSD